MFVVYWTSLEGDHPHPLSKNFNATELVAATKFTESLRAKRRAGEKLAFITIASEHPDCVGEQGVSDILPDGYDWSKQHRGGPPLPR